MSSNLEQFDSKERSNLSLSWVEKASADLAVPQPKQQGNLDKVTELPVLIIAAAAEELAIFYNPSRRIMSEPPRPLDFGVGSGRAPIAEKPLDKPGVPTTKQFELIGKPLVAPANDLSRHEGKITVSENQVKFQTKSGFSLTANDNNLRYKLPDGTSYSIDEKNVLTVKRPGQAKQVFEPYARSGFDKIARSLFLGGVNVVPADIPDEFVYPKEAQFRLFRDADKNGARVEVADLSGELYDVNTSKWKTNNFGVVKHLGQFEVGPFKEKPNGDKSFEIKDGSMVTRKPDGSLRVETQGLTIEIDAAGKTATASKEFGTEVKAACDKYGHFTFDSKELGQNLQMGLRHDAKTSDIRIWTGAPETKVEINLMGDSAAIKVLPGRKFSFADSLR